jgi:MerR family transcriptional regulator, light-induced transcriptional regulator
MVNDLMLEKYLEALLNGSRRDCRSVIEECLQSGIPANQVYMDVIWPVMVEIDALYRNDKINSAQEHMATRINRTIVDQLQNKLPRKPERLKRVVIASADTENGELGAQMIADLFESDGWDVRFLGGGVAEDDLVSFTNSFQPDILVIYGATPKIAPDIRKLIDRFHNIQACPNMRIMLSGGLFARAEGLWEEIGADLYASSAASAVEIANMDESEVPKPKRTINRRKKSTNKNLQTVN